ncbi:hypothetical protein [Flavobacterium sp. W21_SRS_FM6]|uniref:hypothetical protein n=1 Tax=Flavobacterium sp. W21_SRS_FM6 TaxID=3240268 RepID=UPI003F8E69D0
METIAPSPIHHKQTDVRIKAMTNKLRLLVEDVENVGSITIEGQTIELAENVDVNDIPEIHIDTIPNQFYHATVKKRDCESVAYKDIKVIFTAVHV